MKKIVLLGATGIGKTRLLCHHSSLIPAPSIIPVDYTFSIRGNPGSDTEVVLWDCPGGDKEIDRLRPSFVYSSSSSLDNPTHLVLLAFNSVESLLLLEDKFIPEISYYLPNVACILVGIDLDDEKKKRSQVSTTIPSSLTSTAVLSTPTTTNFIASATPTKRQQRRRYSSTPTLSTSSSYSPSRSPRSTSTSIISSSSTSSSRQHSKIAHVSSCSKKAALELLASNNNNRIVDFIQASTLDTFTESLLFQKITEFLQTPSTYIPIALSSSSLLKLSTLPSTTSSSSLPPPSVLTVQSVSVGTMTEDDDGISLHPSIGTSSTSSLQTLINNNTLESSTPLIDMKMEIEIEDDEDREEEEEEVLLELQHQTVSSLQQTATILAAAASKPTHQHSPSSPSPLLPHALRNTSSLLSLSSTTSSSSSSTTSAALVPSLPLPPDQPLLRQSSRIAKRPSLMKLRSENALDRYLSSNDGTKTKFHTVSGSSQHDRRMFMTSMAAATVSDGIIFEEGEGDGTARFEDVEFFTSASITKTTSFSTTTPLPSDYLLDDINIPNERLLRKHKSLTILHPADYSSTPTVLPMTAAMVVSDDKEEKEEKSKMRSKDDSVLVNRATVSTTSSSSSNVSYSFWERLLKPLNYKSAVNK